MNFIVLRIYAEALDRLRVRLNMYLVCQKIKSLNLKFNSGLSRQFITSSSFNDLAVFRLVDQ